MALCSREECLRTVIVTLSEISTAIDTHAPQTSRRLRDDECGGEVPEALTPAPARFTLAPMHCQRSSSQAGIRRPP